ncbi:helix-turn-helix domain-containing protein [Streptomyces sp. WAC 00631]|uniref:helix-turn-helix domain-containing protein n=1 Tax=Streptomyces sp. WAC 00631 TaxID=2203201 RepID=UPI0035A8E109
MEPGTDARGSVGVRPDPAGDWERAPHPSDRLRTFGAFVQALHEHAGLSRAELGVRVHYSKHTVESVELARRMPDPRFMLQVVPQEAGLHACQDGPARILQTPAGTAMGFGFCAGLRRGTPRRGPRGRLLATRTRSPAHAPRAPHRAPFGRALPAS